jgi:hypothetical protein
LKVLKELLIFFANGNSPEAIEGAFVFFMKLAHRGEMD